MTAVATERSTVREVVVHRRRLRPRRVALHAFLIVSSLVWLFPLAWAVYTSFRSYTDTARNGYVSIASSLTLENYANAWARGQIPMFFLNTIVILVPAVILILLLASAIAFAVSRFSFRFNLFLLMLFTAGNLLPAQVIITPLYRMYLALPLPSILSDNGVWYNQFFGIMMIHVAFQLGFCTFVLSNFMKTLPKELTEAALVDGASVLRTFFQVILPLCRPPLAALATLEFTFIYNDFFWALILMFTGNKRPITSALQSLQGEFFSDNNLLAAGAIIIALPTLIVYFVLQRQFIKGLTLGSTKG
jgi:multiple sugar transport system permease protein